MSLTISCINSKYCAVDINYGDGYFFGRVKHSNSEDSPILESVSWDHTGRCLTKDIYNLKMDEFFNSDYVAVADSLEPVT